MVENDTRSPRAGDDPKSAELAGRYMTFKLAEEEYGVEILKVREIIGMMQVTKVPRTRSFIRGVINLRGKVHPVVDLRLKLGMEEAPVTDQTVIIVVRYEMADKDVVMGIIVDEVLEVLNIASEQIEPPPEFGAGAFDTEFILGVGKTDRGVIFLLDIGKVLSTDEQEQLASM